MELGPRTQDMLHAELATERGQSIWQAQLSDAFDDEENILRSLHYGFDGEPIPMRVWMVLFESPSRLIQQEWFLLRDGLRVWLSTVWLGLDHNHARMLKDYPGVVDVDTRPWIYETMFFAAEKPGIGDIFASVGFGQELGQWRHATWEEAMEWHAMIAASVTSGMLPWDGD